MTDTERFELQRPIPASAADIFRIVSDPAGHVAIDSTGMLQAYTGSPATKVGDDREIDAEVDRKASLIALVPFVPLDVDDAGVFMAHPKKRAGALAIPFGFEPNREIRGNDRVDSCVDRSHRFNSARWTLCAWARA